MLSAEGQADPGTTAMLRPLRHAATILILLLPLSGCVVGTVVGTAVDVTATVVETTVDVAAGTVRLIVPDGDDQED